MTIIIIVITVLCITIAHNTASQSSQGPGSEGDRGYSAAIGAKISSWCDGYVKPRAGTNFKPHRRLENHISCRRLTQRTIPAFISPLMRRTCSPEETSDPLRPRCRSDLLDSNRWWRCVRRPFACFDVDVMLFSGCLFMNDQTSLSTPASSPPGRL